MRHRQRNDVVCRRVRLRAKVLAKAQGSRREGHQKVSSHLSSVGGVEVGKNPALHFDLSLHSFRKKKKSKKKSKDRDREREEAASAIAASTSSDNKEEEDDDLRSKV